MKVIVLLLALVAVVLGYHTTGRELDVLRNLQKKLEAPENEPQKTDPVLKTAPNMYSTKRTGTSENPDQTVTLWFGLEEMFTFPGSEFVESLWAMMLKAPLPTDPSFLEGVSDLDLEMLQGQMSNLYETFGEWTGITDMVIRKVVKWIAENKFSCPSVVIDKIFADWVDRSLDHEFESIGGSLAGNFQTAMDKLFPNSPATKRDYMASNATVEVMAFISGELMRDFLSLPVLDIAGFSQTFYYTLVSKLGSAYVNGENVTPSDILETVLTESLDRSHIKCSSRSEMFMEHKYGMKMFQYRLQEADEDFWMKTLDKFLREQILEDELETVTFDESVLMDVSKSITTYLKEVVDIVRQYEEKLESSTDNLEDFLLDVLGQDYSELVHALIEKLEDTENGNRDEPREVKRIFHWLLSLGKDSNSSRDDKRGFGMLVNLATTLFCANLDLFNASNAIRMACMFF